MTETASGMCKSKVTQHRQKGKVQMPNRSITFRGETDWLLVSSTFFSHAAKRAAMGFFVGSSMSVPVDSPGFALLGLELCPSWTVTELTTLGDGKNLESFVDVTPLAFSGLILAGLSLTGVFSSTVALLGLNFTGLIFLAGLNFDGVILFIKSDVDSLLIVAF